MLIPVLHASPGHLHGERMGGVYEIMRHISWWDFGGEKYYGQSAGDEVKVAIRDEGGYRGTGHIQQRPLQP